MSTFFESRIADSTTDELEYTEGVLERRIEASYVRIKNAQDIVDTERAAVRDTQERWAAVRDALAERARK
jgi:hypothetical protein